MLGPHQLFPITFVQSLSHVWLCDPMDCSMPDSLVLHYLPEFAQIQVHWVGGVIEPFILCCSLLLLPSVFPSIRVFSNESTLPIRWPKNWSFSFSISPSREYSGLIFFRMDWFDLLAVQGILKESSPAQQFENTNSLALRLFYGSTLISVYDYWKNHSLNYTELCQQSNISAF